MEDVLSSLATLASHDRLLEAAPLQEYTKDLRCMYSIYIVYVQYICVCTYIHMCLLCDTVVSMESQCAVRM